MFEGPHDVRIRMIAVGICGSDVHYLKTMRCADFIVKEPMVIGHECAGIIEEVGSQIQTLVPGDRVAIEPGISCWPCDHCKLGRYNLCPEMKFFATPPVHGSLANQNMAAWLVGLNTLKIQPFNLPSLGPHDIRIRMKAVGICGSDVYYLKTMRCADFKVKEPMVIGHECAGIIEEVGSQVQTLVPGDRVAIEPGISCWRCDHCKLGRYNLCAEMKFFATPPVHGSLANQIVHPADLCFKLPDNVSLEEGAMCEPLSVSVHACRRASIRPETNVLIMGEGPIGLVTMLSARAFGAPRIVVVDVDDHRLSVAKSLGADDIVKVSTNIQDPMISELE
ncbi:sorbitol dehydrogenase-like isoform X2 [Trifolium pratense]|uniref:sorbitol dehydrogenase-like isoform X2 n=1 Tax=Trifolium pratense TaxID=57577 RepID=UPI001E696319|nr:sorbitol dehydrogenase-like isoform X2 [Trifolium pratense]